MSQLDFFKEKIILTLQQKKEIKNINQKIACLLTEIENKEVAELLTDLHDRLCDIVQWSYLAKVRPDPYLVAEALRKKRIPWKVIHRRTGISRQSFHKHFGKKRIIPRSTPLPP